MNKTTPLSVTSYVYAHWVGLLEPRLMGRLFFTPSRGKQIVSFEYDTNWLREFSDCQLDPSLQLYQGVQYAPHGHANFGLFLDSSPDRWGRVLMQRRSAQLARRQKRPVPNLLASDYLLGVYDAHRMGALRFKTEKEGPFLDNNQQDAAPPWVALRELEAASLALEQTDAEQQPAYSTWLRLLMAPGASLGGARPKASVMAPNEQLWIAKFPSQHDENDIGAWELLAYQLAMRSKIIMADATIKRFNHRHHTFLTKRFDRTEQGERLHFASAMTLLQHSDGDDALQGVSYLELAEFILQSSVKPLDDLEQLWRRMVFYACISNVDDHLRNHGFLYHPHHGWRLSPAFDINPVAHGDGLKLNISQTDNTQSLALIKSVAEFFRLSPQKAEEIIQEIVAIVRTWRTQASALGISTSEQTRLQRAFRLVA